MDDMAWVVIYAVICGVIGFWAADHGRHGFGWFVIAFLVSPLLAAVLLCVLPDESRGSRRIRRGRRPSAPDGSRIRDAFVGEITRGRPQRFPDDRHRHR